MPAHLISVTNVLDIVVFIFPFSAINSVSLCDIEYFTYYIIMHCMYSHLQFFIFMLCVATTIVLN